ncbi:Type I restriction-modification system, specificity subunit S [Enterococcus casseliflavus]|uniref:restriction endonuclease subunit S n=1 Tax=Enterococcus casseliflavus TaxID=37734 RepID=UPI000DF9AC80|nr:restriction endonuclease subunit S [Enterococcus casseliflavus]GEB29896.1 hypothetical protein ECA02_29910 [Enterococcus casseliflavus]STP32910.1 Type I restriction-modification system, specificity subunit S [Enterococcus casseliflavus]
MRHIYLEELCDINIGKTPSRSNPRYWNGSNKWLAISDMKSRNLNQTKECITDLAIQECNMKMVPKGTVLMSFKLSIGKLGITRDDIFTNEAIASFKIINEDILERNYLYYALQTINYKKVAEKAVKGSTLNKAKLKKIMIPLPSFQAQQKIADTLDLASEIIEKRKEQIAEMDKLIQSVFYEIFGDPNKLSKEWKVNLKEVANITTGNTPSRKELENYGNHMEWIKTDNMTFDSLYPSRAAEYLSEIGVNKARIADKESILMTCIAGSKKSIGKVVLLDRAVAFNQQINAITVNGNIHVKYLFYILKFSKVRLEDFANDSMKKMITKSKLETFEINNVDMKRQLEFTSIVEEIESQKKVMEESLHEMENNFNALMQKAFRGDLFPEE